jgi:hypothetical protein
MEDFAPHARKTVLQERLIRNDERSLEMAVDGALCVNDTPADRIDAALASLRGPTV